MITSSKLYAAVQLAEASYALLENVPISNDVLNWDGAWFFPIAANFMKEKKIQKESIALYGIHEGRALHFYGQHIFPVRTQVLSFQSSDIVLTVKDSLPVFQKAFPGMQVLHEGNHFGVTSLSLPFLNPATRERELPKYIIIDLDGKP